MLTDYKDKQEKAYKIFSNAINNNYLSHAYLIDENNSSDSFDIVMSFVKEVLGKKMDDNEKSILFKRIDDGNYPEIKIIVPDGNIIKKQQIIDLQRDFSTKSIEGNKRIYIIRDADKMRSETANSMLKFLEEPDNDILAILMTNNYNAILPTIISRCQVIKLNNFDMDNNNDLLCIAFDFINSVEKNGFKTILKENDILFSKIGLKERDKFDSFFEQMIEIYEDILKKKTDKYKEYDSYLTDIDYISKNNSMDDIIWKIEYLVKARGRIKNNVNINLLIDDVIINIGGKNESSWSKTWR